MNQKDVSFHGELKIFSGTSNLPLAQKISVCSGKPLGVVEIKRFSDGEICVEYKENIRGTDVFIVQSTNQPDSNLFELLVLIDAAKYASASRITAVIPYYGYARQDRKTEPRTSIAARLVADLISAAGANRVLLIDLHASQIQGFFRIPVDHLYAKPVFVNILLQEFEKEIKEDSLVIVAPDVGAVKIDRSYAKKLYNVPIAIIDKRRLEKNRAEVLNIIGEVADKNALMIDDMVDTAGTVAEAAKALIEKGAKRISAACTHAVLSGPAIERIANSPISHFFVTDTIAIPPHKLIDKIKVVSIAPLLAEAIRKIHSQGSVSELFAD